VNGGFPKTLGPWKVYDLDDNQNAKLLGVSKLDREMRADLYAHSGACSYLVQECKCNNSLSDGVEQLEKTVSTLLTNSHRVDRAIIIMDSFGNECKMFKRKKHSQHLYKKMGKRDVPIVVGRNLGVELYLRSELKPSRGH
jgi:hypothetical protein